MTLINPDGTQKWAFTTLGDVDSSPSIGIDGTIYVGSDDYKLYAINPDGTRKWAFTTLGDVNSSPLIGIDGIIYVGSDDDKLYAINPDGTQKWAFATGGDIGSSPSIGSDGTIYIGSEDKKLYALNSDCGGLANSVWPKFRGNLKNTGRSNKEIIVFDEMGFAFSNAGQSCSKSLSVSNNATKDVLIMGCTFDNPEFVLETQLPLTIATGSRAQLSVRVQPSSSKLYTSKCSVIYTLDSRTQTELVNLSSGIFIEDNSERAYAAHRAVDAYNSCLVKDPSSVATRNNLGVLYRLLHEYDIAEQYLMQALSSSLNARYGYTGIKMNLGVVKSDKGTQSDAFTFYSSSESDISGSASSSSLAPQIYYNQAWEYYKGKSLTQALAAVNKTISHQSANSYLKAKAYVLRGSIYYSNNDVANTKKDMETAKSLDPSGPIGRMADENLGAINATGVERENDKGIPTEYALLTNYPNPFNPATTIRFQLPARSNVRLLVYDITGREIRTLVDDNMDAGSYSVRWDGEDNAGRTVTSGVYVVRMNAGYYTQTQKAVLLR